jgi:CheY-like chemotaxis protein
MDDLRASAGAVRVLIVEDNLGIAMMMSALLGRLGHEVRTVHDGQAALAAVEEYRPQLVLLDIGLPQLSGYEVARRMRALEAGRQAILVALTGYGLDSDREAAFEAGFDEHLVKPIGLDTLQALLARARR